VSENARDEMNLETIELSEPLGAPSAFSCPACGGVLWEVGRSRGRGRDTLAARFDSQALEALDQAELIRKILLERDVAGG